MYKDAQAKQQAQQGAQAGAQPGAGQAQANTGNAKDDVVEAEVVDK